MLRPGSAALRAGTAANSAGPTAVTCGSTLAGPRAMPAAIRRPRGGTGRARARRHPGARHSRGAALLQATRTVPIVFVHRAPILSASGFVESLARPGGNATGFTMFEYSFEREMAGAAQSRSHRA